MRVGLTALHPSKGALRPPLVHRHARVGRKCPDQKRVWSSGGPGTAGGRPLYFSKTAPRETVVLW